MRYAKCSRCVIIGLLTMLGMVFVQFPAAAQVAIFEDDFDDPAGDMPSPGTPPNTDPAWIWNETAPSGLVNRYNGASRLLMPLESSAPEPDQMIVADGITLEAGVSYALIFVYNMPGNSDGGDQMFGFAGDTSWSSSGDSRVFHTSGGGLLLFHKVGEPLSQETYKLENVIEELDQSLMMKVDGSGNITLWYFEGILKDPNSASWVELIDRTDFSPEGFDPTVDLMTLNPGPQAIGVTHVYSPPDRGGCLFRARLYRLV